MQTQPTLSTRTHWESRHLLWGDAAHSGMGLRLAWLLDRRKQPQIWGKEWKACFNILKQHSSEECICPYTSLRLLVCWLTWLVTKQHTYEWSKIKTSVQPFVGYHLLHPMIFPHILYSLAITITFAYFWTLWLPLIHPFSPTTPSTCKSAEKQKKPEAPVWLPTFWACKAQKTWFEPMISSKEIKIQRTWFHHISSMSRQKKKKNL